VKLLKDQMLLGCRRKTSHQTRLKSKRERP